MAEGRGDARYARIDIARLGILPQAVWPAAQAAVATYLPPELQPDQPQPPPGGGERTRHRPSSARRASPASRISSTPQPAIARPSSARSLNSASSQHEDAEERRARQRATMAATMLSKQLAGGAVGRKAREWEEVVAAHRSRSRPGSTSASLNASRTTSSDHLQPPPGGGAPVPTKPPQRMEYGDQFASVMGGPDGSTPSGDAVDGGVVAIPRDRGSTSASGLLRPGTADGAFATPVVQRPSSQRDGMRGAPTSASVGSTAAAAAAAQGTTSVAAATTATAPRMPKAFATPGAAAWRARPLSAPRHAAMAAFDAPPTPSSFEYLVGGPAPASGMGSQSQPGMATATPKEPKEEEGDATLLATPSRAEQWQKDLETHRRETERKERSRSVAEEEEDDDDDEEGLARASSPPLLPPPPPKEISLAWAHPQRLLRALAQAEFSWGPEQQRLLEGYVRDAIASASAGAAGASAGGSDDDGESEGAGDGDGGEGDGIDEDTLEQLSGAPGSAEHMARFAGETWEEGLSRRGERSILRGLAADRHPPVQQPRSAGYPATGESAGGGAAAATGGGADGPRPGSAAPPSWVERLAVSETERVRRARETHLASRLFSDPPPPTTTAASARSAREHRKAAAATARAKAAFVDDDVGLAALAAVLAQDVAAGKPLTREQRACIEAERLVADVADGKLLSAEELEVLEGVEATWRAEAEAALARMSGPVIGAELQEVRLRYTRARRAQLKQRRVDDLERKVAAIAREEHKHALREWRRLQGTRRQVAEWREGLQREFGAALDLLKGGGLDLFVLRDRPELMADYLDHIGRAAAAAGAAGKSDAAADSGAAPPKAAADAGPPPGPTRTPKSPPQKRRPASAAPPRYAIAHANAARRVATTVGDKNLREALISRSTLAFRRKKNVGDMLERKAEEDAARTWAAQTEEASARARGDYTLDGRRTKSPPPTRRANAKQPAAPPPPPPGASLGLVRQRHVLPHHQKTALALEKEAAFALKRQRTREAAQRTAARMAVINAQKAANKKLERHDGYMDFLGSRLAADAIERAQRIYEAEEAQRHAVEAVVCIQRFARGQRVRTAVRARRAAKRAAANAALKAAARTGLFVWHVGGWTRPRFVSYAPPKPPKQPVSATPSSLCISHQGDSDMAPFGSNAPPSTPLPPPAMNHPALGTPMVDASPLAARSTYCVQLRKEGSRYAVALLQRWAPADAPRDVTTGDVGGPLVAAKSPSNYAVSIRADATGIHHVSIRLRQGPRVEENEAADGRYEASTPVDAPIDTPVDSRVDLPAESETMRETESEKETQVSPGSPSSSASPPSPLSPPLSPSPPSPPPPPPPPPPPEEDPGITESLNAARALAAEATEFAARMASMAHPPLE